MSETGSDPIAAVVLAAGASRRLGQPKQLIEFAGESLLHRTARIALESGCTAVFVVLGFEADRMRPELDGLPVDTLTNPEWTEGISSSLRCGVAAARDYGAKGVLLMVCDQPGLTADHLRHLLHRHRESGSAIVSSEYGGRSGVPAVFAESMFSELLTVRGDQGARGVIDKHRSLTQYLPWPEGVLDLDSPEQLRKITMG